MGLTISMYEKNGIFLLEHNIKNAQNDAPMNFNEKLIRAWLFVKECSTSNRQQWESEPL